MQTGPVYQIKIILIFLNHFISKAYNITDVKNKKTFENMTIFIFPNMMTILEYALDDMKGEF